MVSFSLTVTPSTKKNVPAALLSSGNLSFNVCYCYIHRPCGITIFTKTLLLLSWSTVNHFIEFFFIYLFVLRPDIKKIVDIMIVVTLPIVK